VNRWRWALILLATVAGALAQALAGPWGAERGVSWLALPFFAAGGLLLLSATRREQAPSDRLLGTLFLVAGLGAGAAAAAYTEIELSVAQLLSYAFALGALAVAASFFDRARGVPASPTTPFTWLDALCLTGVTAIAFALRLWRLGEIPPVIWDDEIKYLEDGIGLFQELSSPFISGAWDAVYFHAYSIAAAVLAFDDRNIALRMVSVVPGALSVPLLYLLARELFDRTHATCASLLLALSAWHILLSRHGYHWAINPFVELIALYWLVRGRQSGKLRHYVYSGFGIGLGVLYTYSAAFMPLAIVLFAGYLLIREPEAFRRHLAGFVLLTIAAVVVAAPRLSTLQANPDMFEYHRAAWFLSHDDQGDPLWLFLRQLLQIFASFNYQADDTEIFVPRSSQPLLDPLTATAFGLGIFYALYRIRQPGWALILFTFVVLLFPAALAVGPTHWATAWRANGAAPAVFALASVPFAILWRIGHERRVHRFWITGLFAAAFATIAIINCRIYFVEHPAKPAWQQGIAAVHFGAARRVLATAPGVRVLVNHDLDQWPHVRLLTFRHRTYEGFVWPDHTLLPSLLLDDLRPTLVLGSTRRIWDDVTVSGILMDLLAHYYPGGVREDVRNDSGAALFSSYFLEPPQIQHAHGLEVRLGGPHGTPIGSGSSFDWRASPSGSFPFVAELSGTLVIPADGIYRVFLSDITAEEILLDGERLPATPMAAGLYDLSIRVEVKEPVQARLMWARDAGDAEPISPAQLLRRRLPTWGVMEQQTLAQNGAVTRRRWMPVVWFAAVDQRPSELAVERLEWAGDLLLPRSGSHRVLLHSQQSARVWVDDRLLLSRKKDAEGEKEIAAEVVAGTHHVRVVLTSPPWPDVALFWIDPESETWVLGGLQSRPSHFGGDPTSPQPD
jgi:4-amino-4-deoxy-L-arabinose transferase-like glycosyltransferase